MKWQYLCSSCGAAIAPGDTGWTASHGPGKCGTSKRDGMDLVLALLAFEKFERIAADSVRAVFSGLRQRKQSQYVDECVVVWETDAVIHARRADRMRKLAEQHA